MPSFVFRQCITADRAVPLVNHVQAVHEFQQWVDIKQLQWSLGLISFYQQFILGPAGILRPISDTLRGPKTILEKSPVIVKAISKAMVAECSATQQDPHT